MFLVWWCMISFLELNWLKVEFRINGLKVEFSFNLRIWSKWFVSPVFTLTFLPKLTDMEKQMPLQWSLHTMSEQPGPKDRTHKQMGPNETQKLLHSKGNYKQGEKTALRLGENNSERSNRQRINLKNRQATPPAQLQKNKWPNQKMGQRTKQTLLQGRHTDG